MHLEAEYVLYPGQKSVYSHEPEENRRATT